MHRAGNADFVEKRENVPCLGVSSGGNFRDRIACNETKEQDNFGGKWIYSLSYKYR